MVIVNALTTSEQDIKNEKARDELIWIFEALEPTFRNHAIRIARSLHSSQEQAAEDKIPLLLTENDISTTKKFYI